MPKFVVEREFSGAGQLTTRQLRGLAQQTNAVLMDMDPGIQWNCTFVTSDKLYCVYIAPDSRAILEHARRVGLPASVVARVESIIDPTAAEE